MMKVCRICLQTTESDPPYHPACLSALFGSPILPRLDFSLPSILRLATEMAGKMSISGVQEKVSLRLSDDPEKLEIAPSGGRYILKPDPSRFAFIAANEHLTMSLARQADIEVPVFGLFNLQDGATAYLIRRFDRQVDGSKLAVEDFCQLTGKSMRDKYEGSGELCVRVLRQHATEPAIEIRRLFKILLFGWCVSNGDQHLKNFSLLTLPNGIRRLSPAYDLICTRLPIPDDRSLSLSISGKKNNLTRRHWLDFADYCQLSKPTAQKLIERQIGSLESSVSTIRNSFLPDDLKMEYAEILRENTARLSLSE